MKWCKTIALGRPLREVRLRSPGSAAGCATSARLDAEREKAAYDRGVVDGEKRLSQQLLQQRAELLEVQNGILASLRDALPRVARQAESGLIDLAIEVASKLVSGLPISREMVEAAVRGALAEVEATSAFDVFLHPEDLALLQQCNSPALLPPPGNEKIRFLASPDVSRGGCLVQTRFGLVDARRETKLELLRRSLKE
jgi:flagellar assembly protein FliH